MNPSPEPGSVDMTALCWLDGRLGSYLAILGFYNTHYQSLWSTSSIAPKTETYSESELENCCLQRRIGSGLIFLRVGGSRAVPVFEKCVCIEKTVVPLIETGQSEW